MDTLLKELDIDLFKIDVEGAEMKVLKGSENLLKKGTRLIIESFQPTIIRNILFEIGYKINPIGENNYFAYNKMNEEEEAS